MVYNILYLSKGLIWTPANTAEEETWWSFWNFFFSYTAERWTAYET